MQRDAKPNFHKLETKNIPYMDLLEKVSERNPAYDEKVYPAYWQHEPIGLTLAKKQYQFMQAGDDESTAFQKAEEYVDQLENKSYVEVMSLRNALEKDGAQAPFMRDPSVASDILMWQETLRSTKYHELELADQGEIDYMIQTKILKWNEVERERRMKDPVFANQFRKLRTTLLEADPAQKHARNLVKVKHHHDEVLAIFGANFSNSRALSPFYLEDYIKYFRMYKTHPDPKHWAPYERTALSSWIINCVANREAMKNLDAVQIKLYFEMLGAQFFPLRLTPDKADQYEVPTLEGLRKLLHDHDVGYKKERGKTLVHRYYKIPALLYPVESLAASLLLDVTEAT